MRVRNDANRPRTNAPPPGGEVVSDLKGALLGLPDAYLATGLRPLIECWSDPPKAIELLKAIDFAIHGAGASGFVLQGMQALYDVACQREGVSHDDVAKLATWRDKP